MNSKNRKLWLLFLVALVLRLIPALWYSQAPSVDANAYHQIALHLSRGQGFTTEHEPTADKEPLLPFIGGLIYFLFGENYHFVYIFQSLLSALIVVLAYKISRILFHSENAALLTALAVTVYPNFILYSKTFLTEIPAAFLIALLVYCLLRCKPAQYTWFIASGLTLGCLVLTKAAFLFLVPFLFLYFLFFYWKRWNKTLIRGVALLFIITLVLVSVWTLRNYAVFGKFIPVVNRGGTALFYGVYIPYNNMYTYDADYDPVEKAIMGNETDATKLDERFYHAAKVYVMEHPLDEFFFYLKKMGIMWYGPADSIGYPLQWFTGSAKAITEKPILQAVFGMDARATLIILTYVGLYWIVILLAFYGLWKERKNKSIWLLMWPVIYGTLFYPIVLVSARYKEPLLPLVFVLAGYGWVKRKEIWKKIRVFV